MLYTKLIATALFFLSTANSVSSLSSSCDDIECTKLPLVPPRWRHNGKDVTNVALMCMVQSDCSLDIDDILRNKTSHGHDMDQQFVSVDLHFTCVNSSKLDFSSTSHANNSICATIRWKDCALSWENLAYLGNRLHLLHVETIVTPLSPPPPTKIPINSPLINGLSQVNHLQLTFINISSLTRVEDYFWLNKSSMDNVSSLSMECFEGDKRTNTICSTAAVIFNQSKLQKSFPHLQSLVMAGVYPVDIETDLSFPWDSEPMPLPLSFSHSKFQQRLYSDGYIVERGGGMTSRTLAVVGNIGINVTKLCPYQKLLNVVVLRDYGLLTIPHDCFSPARGQKSQLYHIELSMNMLTVLPDNLFYQLNSLEELHLWRNQILHLKPGQFDGLAALRTLDLNDNNITIVKAGTFTELVSLENLFITENGLTDVEPGSLPNYSHNLTFLDFRFNDLERLPIDCVTLPNLKRCDCDHNKRLSLSNLPEIIYVFNPIRMYVVQPLAYYGETFSYSDVGLMHESDQSEISLKDCGVTQIEFNMSWPHEMKQELAAFLSFFQIDLGTVHQADQHLQCDCGLFDLRNFIETQQSGAPASLLSGSTYLHSLLLSPTNFKTWKCVANPILMVEYSEESFLSMDSKNFICPAEKNTVCPTECSCYRGANDNRWLLDCRNQDLTSFPENVAIPDGVDELIVDLEHNSIVTLPDCDDERYRWLKSLTQLNLQHNEITPVDTKSFEKFLRCLPKVTHLFLAYNNIKEFPKSIAEKRFTDLSISGNKLACCGTYWMKEWLQEYNKAKTIQKAQSIHCADRDLPIVQLERINFLCFEQFGYYIIGLLVFVMFLVGIGYKLRFEIKILLFERFNCHPRDNLNDRGIKENHILLLFHDDSLSWVEETLLPGLEKLGYKVFVPQRDRQSGIITKRMADALETTHRVVTVLTQAFIDTELIKKDDGSVTPIVPETMIDLYNAKTHAPPWQRYLVFIKMDKELDVDEHKFLKPYLNTGSFVDVRSKKFWSKLCYWLPESPKIFCKVKDELPNPDPNRDEATTPLLPERIYLPKQL